MRDSNLPNYMEEHFTHVSEPNIGEKELEYVTDCIKSGWISSLGKYISKFEKTFAQNCNVQYALSVINGTEAIHLALAALDIGPGDEVIIPNLTFIATANAVTYVGAKPVFVDSRKDTWELDHEHVKEKINKNTKAIIPVHLYGHPCDMDPLISIAKENNLFIIEDCAEAQGSLYKNKPVGSLGDIGCFSFYGNKVMTTGEGGMCTTNNKELAEKMELLKDHGMSKKIRYYHPVKGFNFRMTNIQSAIGVAQLERIDQFINLKREHAAKYNEILKDVKGITLPPEAEYAKSVYWMYSILIENDYPLTRDQLMEELKKNEIETRPFFIPMTYMPPYSSQEQFPIAGELSKKGINLPSSTKLPIQDVQRIANIIKDLGS